MLRLLTLVVVFFALLHSGAQEPAAPLSPAAAAAAVVDQVNEFYSDYWEAWQERDAARVADRLDQEFTLFTYVPGQGVAQADRNVAAASVRQFFEAIEGQELRWSHVTLAVEPRSETEALATVRSEFSWSGQHGEIELSLEVLRKGADQRWRLLRKWSEKITY